jgi:ribosomal protein L19
MDKINLVTAAQIKSDLPVFHPGDTITVSVKVIEGEKERLQQFKGIVMGIRGSGLSKSFRVRTSQSSISKKQADSSAEKESKEVVKEKPTKKVSKKKTKTAKDKVSE